jgi:hypothetical protein
MGPTRFNIKKCLNQGKTSIKGHLHEEWADAWKKSNTCRQTKHWFPKVDAKKSSEFLAKDKEETGKLVAFVTGFNTLAYHEFNLGSTDSPTCRLCDDAREDAIHLVEDCPVMAVTSLNNFGVFGTKNQWSTNSLTRFISSSRIRDLLTQ